MSPTNRDVLVSAIKQLVTATEENARLSDESERARKLYEDADAAECIAEDVVASALMKSHYEKGNDHSSAVIVGKEVWFASPHPIDKVPSLTRIPLGVDLSDVVA